MVDYDMVHAHDWRHPGDVQAYRTHKAVKCTEVLVPDQVDQTHIARILVSCRESQDKALTCYDKVIVFKDVFFL